MTEAADPKKVADAIVAEIEGTTTSDLAVELIMRVTTASGTTR